MGMWRRIEESGLACAPTPTRIHVNGANYYPGLPLRTFVRQRTNPAARGGLSNRATDDGSRNLSSAPYCILRNLLGGRVTAKDCQVSEKMEGGSTRYAS